MRKRSWMFHKMKAGRMAQDQSVTMEQADRKYDELVMALVSMQWPSVLSQVAATGWHWTSTVTMVTMAPMALRNMMSQSE